MGPGRTPRPAEAAADLTAASLLRGVVSILSGSSVRHLIMEVQNQFISDTKEINSGYHQPLGTCLESWVNSLGLFGGGC